MTSDLENQQVSSSHPGDQVYEAVWSWTYLYGSISCLQDFNAKWSYDLDEQHVAFSYLIR
jgi:hypothetical protein